MISFDITHIHYCQRNQQQRPMQSNINPPHIVRSSYGFPIQEPFSSKSPNNKPLLQHHQSFTHNQYTHQQNVGASIKNLEARIESVESPGRKKVISGECSPTLFSTHDNKYRHQFPSSSDLRGQDTSNEQFLRGSCSNILRKFDSGNNTSTNLRNTTHFNPIGKFPNSPNDSRKPPQDHNPFKSSNASKGGTESTSSSGTYLQRPADNKSRINQTLSRTPSKLFPPKNLEESVRANKTPVKYKNVFEGESKQSGIGKGGVEAEGKKFRSLNEIMESKAREKLAMEKVSLPRRQSRVVNGLEVGGTLGKGKFGEVFLCRHREAGFVAAVKKIVKARVVEFKMVEQLSTEVRLHASLEHPNIVKFYGCFEEGEDIYLVMEYMNGGTLFDYLNEVSCLPLRETVEYLRDVIEAVAYMHDKSIAHRDIKPENIVISSEGVAKLCDFGWSALVETSRKTYCGTFDYAPPEILERKAYDTSVDLWCIGVLTYELLTGRVPFEGEQRNVVMEKIVNVDKQKVEYPPTVPPEAREFIEALMQKDPALRPKSQDLLKFKLFSLFPRVGSKHPCTSPLPKKTP